MKNERIIIKEVNAGISGIKPTIKKTNTAVQLYKRIFYQSDIKLISVISARYKKRFYVDTKQGFISIHEGGIK